MLIQIYRSTCSLSISGGFHVFDTSGYLVLTDLFSYSNPCKPARGIVRKMLQYAPRLAQFYLLVNEKRTDKLHQSIGGDGAPVCGTSYLLSFLNVCERLASSRERYLTFGTDEDESSPVSRNYVRSVPVPPIQNGVFCHFYLKLCPD